MLKTIYTSFALFTLHFAFYTPRDTLDNPQRETTQSNTCCISNTHTLRCKLLRNMTRSTLHAQHSTLNTPLPTPHSTLSTLHSTLHTLYSTLLTPHSTHHTLRHTLQFTPRTPHHKVCAKIFPVLY